MGHVGLVERFSVKTFAIPRTDNYVQDRDSLAECYWLARMFRKVLISLGTCIAHVSEALGAVRIAQRESGGPEADSTDVDSRVEEGCVDSTKTCSGLVSASNMYMRHARGAMRRNSHAR